MKNDHGRKFQEEFTPIESAILQLLVSGFDMLRISEELNLSEVEVAKVCIEMMKKRKVKCLKELALLGLMKQ